MTVIAHPGVSPRAPAPFNARIASAASTNATSVKADAGRVYSVTAGNNTATKLYLKLYDKATAPTVGTDTPLLTLILPGNGGFGATFDPPIPFEIGIAYAITGSVADSDTTAVAANDVHGLIQYA